MLNQLEQIRSESIILKRRIKKLIEQRDTLYFSLFPSAVRYDKEHVQTSPEDMMPKTFSEIAELDDRIIELKGALAFNMKRVSVTCYSLKPTYRKVMALYYGGAYTNKQIAYMMHKTTNNIKQIKYKALKKLPV